jgi:serine/threonine-protein kinase
MRIGSYEVLLELARGGMGKVYLARSVGPRGVERLVAIKRAHRHLAGKSGAVADRFLDEAQTAALVHHSNVIGVHQAGCDEDGYFLVLDYVEGISLCGLVEAAELRAGRVPPRIALTVVCDALAGLHAAHEATDRQGRPLRILHRDVSAENLLVGRDGVTRLGDFGIAKSALSIAVTDQAYVHGKLAYMAPEYLRRKPVDRTLDVYGMGITLYLALSGDLPWPGAEEAQLVPAILLSGAPPLATRSVLMGPIDDELCAVVDRACHRDPKERFQTARAMLDALEAASTTIGGLARHVEVAEFVEGLVGGELQSRRELIKSCRAALDAGAVPVRRRRADRGAWKPIGYVAVAITTFAIVTALLRSGATRREPNVGSRSPEPVSAAAPNPSAVRVEPSAFENALTSSVTPPIVTPKTDDSSNERRSESTKPKPLSGTAPRAVAPAHPRHDTENLPEPGGAVPFSSVNPYR